MKKIICLVMALVMCMCFVSCGKTEKSETDAETTAASTETTASAAPVKVAIEVENFGTMTLELYPDIAPITVENFLNYVKEGFYDGLTFHRIYKGFMIQGGDPDGTGAGGNDLENIKGEFSANGIKNDLSHTRGVISMARRSNSMDSASSQFFICHADSTFLDGQYAAFGKMIDGYDVLDAIASVKVKDNGYNEKSSPVEKVIMSRVYIVEE